MTARSPRSAGGSSGPAGKPKRRDARLGRFLRGLAIGAFVGAAIAGARVWRRGGHREDPGSRA